MTNNLVEKSRWVWEMTLQIHLKNPETRIASSLSPIEIFVSLYYGKILNFNASNPNSSNRDRFIISKGHGSISMYPILADLGFFSFSELDRVGAKGGILGGIPDPIIPGYETVNGSLGHGLGVGCGIAYSLLLDDSASSVFILLGDGELHEGACWEAIMFSAHHRLNNMNVIVDKNNISMLDHTKNIVDHRDLEDKFSSFGFDTDSCDGHDVNILQEKLLEMKYKNNNKPKVLIANTLKGKGVPSLENQPLSHIMTPSKEELKTLINRKNNG